MDKSISCCFTGHRPNKLPWGDREDDPRCVALKTRLLQAVEGAYTKGYRHFHCGMAQGCDLYFCEAVILLKQKYHGIVLESVIPCQEQAHRWSPADQARYRALLDACDYETLVQRHYDRGCMLRRNRYMVDRSSLLIAVYDGQPNGGGTLYTLNYAMKEGLEVVIVEPII